MSSRFSSCYQPMTIRSTSDNVAGSSPAPACAGLLFEQSWTTIAVPVTPRNGAQGGSSLDAHSPSTCNGDCYIIQHIRAASLLPSPTTPLPSPTFMSLSIHSSCDNLVLLYQKLLAVAWSLVSNSWNSCGHGFIISLSLHRSSCAFVLLLVIFVSQLREYLFNSIQVDL
ncbi:hypothetical protein MPTK1_2g11410 [Marchantia polymorpha subsp. ruderalis]|uniref:Uncharacterized protein n=1 Tax=Marchantia polymorpha TaxID=3197 RepID=A0A2R6XCH4_MARPO|nr:hypothetical protein MARPO_0023s0109 [Marchantia polymorpha]BBN01939.1 hypothetical protein Mp_2g11410 [Marchantia polymorpha subsp. ruderalis]|eukprot:PTQ43802.1 hypothetical protein MARPO_0023s0109 [Marchantia polymorpha]